MVCDGDGDGGGEGGRFGCEGQGCGGADGGEEGSGGVEVVREHHAGGDEERVGACVV